MSLEEEFDRMMRQKADGAKFPFDEANWEKASDLIAKERANNLKLSYKKYYKIGAFSLVLVTLLSISFLLHYSESVRNVQQAEKLQLSSNNKLSKITSNNIDKTQLKSAESSNQLLSALTSKKSLASLKIDNNLSIATKVSKSKAITPHITIPTVNDQTRPEESLLNAENVLVISEQSDSKAEENGIEASVFASQKTEELKITPLQIIQTPLVYSYFEPSISNSQVNIHNVRDDDYARKGRQFNKHFLDLEMGAAYIFGWQDQGQKDGAGLTWFAGINYAYQFCDQIGFGAGVQMYNLGHMNQDFYSVSQKDFSFGATESETLVACNSMLFVSIPVKFLYIVDQDLSLSAGLNAGYLINASNTITSYQLADGVKLNPVTKSETTIYEGMSSFNLMLTGSLLKKINKRFALQAELNYGLTDLIANNSNNSVKQTTSAIRLGLNYRICTK